MNVQKEQISAQEVVEISWGRTTVVAMWVMFWTVMEEDVMVSLSMRALIINPVLRITVYRY